MRWVRDATGRFPRRPHYEAFELDAACEDLIGSFLKLKRKLQLRGHPQRERAYALSTDDLTVLIEQRTADLDLYADLSAEGSDVEAVTDFVPGQRPRVRISKRLGEDPRREHRLRTTLAHELAHVVFHDFIWWFDDTSLDARQAAALSPRCHLATGSGVDWMEWQAGYAAGALLMPTAGVRAVLGEIEGPSAVWVRSPAARAHIKRVQDTFGVSADAARVRLLQLGYLVQRPLSVRRAPLPDYVRRGRRLS